MVVPFRCRQFHAARQRDRTARRITFVIARFSHRLTNRSGALR
jgi:hypothetical protein